MLWVDGEGFSANLSLQAGELCVSSGQHDGWEQYTRWAGGFYRHLDPGTVCVFHRLPFGASNYQDDAYRLASDPRRRQPIYFEELLSEGRNCREGRYGANGVDGTRKFSVAADARTFNLRGKDRVY